MKSAPRAGADKRRSATVEGQSLGVGEALAQRTLPQATTLREVRHLPAAELIATTASTA